MTISNNGVFQFFIVLASGLGGLAGFLTYMETRKHRKMQDEVMALDRQIKELELGRRRIGQI